MDNQNVIRLKTQAGYVLREYIGEKYAGSTQHGWEREYLNDGDVLIREWHYRNGKMDGPINSYHPNGQLSHKQSYEKGKPIGIGISYDAEGNELTRCEYRKGEAFEGVCGNESHMRFYSSGKLMKIEEHGKVVWTHDGPPDPDIVRKVRKSLGELSVDSRNEINNLKNAILEQDPDCELHALPEDRIAQLWSEWGKLPPELVGIVAIIGVGRFNGKVVMELVGMENFCEEEEDSTGKPVDRLVVVVDDMAGGFDCLDSKRRPWRPGFADAGGEWDELPKDTSLIAWFGKCIGMDSDVMN